jgi:hypothetical protein
MPDPNVVTPPAAEPNAAPAAEPNATPAFLEQIPEPYRDKPWAKENAKDPDTFFKFVDNQNAMVGKKGVIIPDEGAPAEQVNEYLKAIGVPETPDEYEFTPIEELKDGKRDAEFEKAVKNIMREAHIPKAAATKLAQGYEKLLFDRNKEQVEQQKAEDAAFDKFNKDFFGENKETIVLNAQKILRETLPKEVVPALDKMNAEQLAMVVAVTDSVYKKFGAEDGFRGGKPGGDFSGGETYETLSAQQRELMAKPGYDDWRHADHASLMEQNKVIMDKMRAIKK